LTLPGWFSGWSLSRRIVALSLVLLLLVQVAGFAVVRSSIDRNGREQVARTLALDERIWLRTLAQNAEKLRLGATLLASDYGFRSAVASADEDTIRSALENHGERIGASVAALLDTRLALRAVAGGGADASTLAPVLAGALPVLAAQGTQLVLVGRTPYQFVLVPMRAPLVIGWVLMGFPLSQALADDFHSLLGAHVAVLSAPPGGAEHVTVTTLDARHLPQLEATGVDGQELPTDEGRLLARRLHMPAAGGVVDALILRSIDAVVAPFLSLQYLLAAIAALAVVLFGVGMAVAAGRVTTPLRALGVAARRVGRGNYGKPVRYTQRRDEIGDLARSFDHMRVSIAEQQAEVRRLAFQDRLTGLPNRVHFREAVQRAIERSRGTAAPLAVLTLDLDRFKLVNGVLGHHFGDRLLVAVAERLAREVAGPDDTVARLGGNTFALLLPREGAQGALAAAARIVASFETPLALEEHTVDLSAGIGIACWPAHAADGDLLRARSEMAMYVAKRSTAGVLLYDPGLESASTRNLSLLTELRHALGHGELRLYLQPKVRLSDGAVTGAEALVRWAHPQRGLVPPMDFIPFAEQTGFVRQITGWMLEEAAAAWRGLQLPGVPLRLSVNLSTRDLLDAELVLRLPALLARHGVPAGGLCLEITESAIMDDPARAEATLNRLAEMGFGLSIDDFGTGYSSLAYLKRLPVDELKIDKSFVLGMQTDEDDATIVRSTIDLAHNLGLKVVAEGVETADLYDRLAGLECDDAQGYHISRPLPAAEFGAWRRRWLQAPVEQNS
jgi:diguanylate cyclase (GGDEF)-like protein